MIPSLNMIDRKSISILFLISLLFLGSLNAQITEVNYMKVKGDADEYLKIEQEWKKAHQRRLDGEMIYAWYLIRKHFGGTDAPYDYITITVYPTMGSIQSEYPDKLFEGLNQELIDKTEDSRDLVKTEIYDTPIILEVINLPQYLNMDFMKVEQGNDDAYLLAEDEIWKPAHAAMKKGGLLTTWSVYRQLYPGAYGGEYNYVTVNGFADFKKVSFAPEEGWEELFKKVHPGLNFDEAMKRTLDSRVMVKTELWELLDKVSPQ